VQKRKRKTEEELHQLRETKVNEYTKAFQKIKAIKMQRRINA
jgi:hypothetical protein